MKIARFRLSRTLSFASLVAVLALSVLGSSPVAAAPSGERADLRLAIVLVVADTAPAAADTGPSVPEHARKALEDVSRFLHYKSFRLLDTAWMRSSEHAQTVVQAPDGGTYRVTVTFEPVTEQSTRVQVRQFRIVEASPTPRAERADAAGTAAGPTPPPNRGEVLSTSLSMEMGETVVVGTSRLDGTGKALVALLTVRPF